MRRLILKSLVYVGIFTVIFTGCAPNQMVLDAYKLDWTGWSLNELGRISNSTKRQLWFYNHHLIAMIGEPELKIKMSDLPILLREDSDGDPEYSARILRDLYRSYQTGLERRSEYVIPDENTWRNSKRFNNLEVWLYNFKDPPEAVVGGLFSRGHGVFLTESFLIEDSRVIAHRGIFRTFKRKR